MRSSHPADPASFRGVYLVGSYEQEGALTRIGQFFELEAAIAAAIPNHPAHQRD